MQRAASMKLTLLILLATLAMSSAMSLRRRLLSGAKSYGPVCMSDSPAVVELLASTGYGHLVIDHEHGPADTRSGQDLLRAVDAVRGGQAARPSGHPTEPIVRVPCNDDAYMKKVLDSMRLPGGVLVPMVEDAASAERAVAATRYPRQAGDPADEVDGVRGCAFPFVRASGYGTDPDYMARCREELLVMVQVESAMGVESIPEIASVPGVDAVFLGPFDLSCSIGKAGMFDDREVRDLISAAERAVLESEGCMLAGFRSGGRGAREMFEAGYSLVCGSVDLGLLREGARRDLEEALGGVDTHHDA